MNNSYQINNDIEQISVSDSLSCSPEDIPVHLKSNNTFNIFHVNIRSINCNFSNLLTLLYSIKINIDIIILTECWLRKTPFIPILPGFESFTSNYKKQNDGVVAYIRNGLECTVDVSEFHDANCIIVKFTNDVAIVAVYRSPSYTNLKPFYESLNSALNTITSYKTSVIIGDININISSTNNDPNSDEYLNMIATHGMLPAYTLPTRENSCLDHVILRSSNYVSTFVLDSLITDHAPILLCCNTNLYSISAKRFTQKCNISAVVNEIESTDFTSVLNSSDPEMSANLFVELISNIVAVHSSSIKIPSRKRIIKPWITPGLLKCIRHRDKLYQKSKKEPNNDIHKIIYIRYRTFCNNLLKRIKKEFEESEITKAKGNPKKTWNVIKRIANLQKTKTDAGSLLKISNNPMSSINIVNKFFANVGKNLASAIQSQLDGSINAQHNTNLQYIPDSTSQFSANSMALFSVDDREVENIITNLRCNCAVGWDGISKYYNLKPISSAQDYPEYCLWYRSKTISSIYDDDKQIDA
ncbi:uncharacterized protein LOC131849153 [Achroia grisella]|uniref:uncharacterized protein LOC131849153 n=1 Tax=Achroia grisella TaxID=688607 RepID=UPI0027D2C545|nr:uncharacterized protein LOC131849153 [Achroia grisella]